MYIRWSAPSACLLLVLGSSGCWADSHASAGQAQPSLSGKAKLGFIYSRAQSMSTSLNSGALLSYQRGRLTHTIKGNTYYTHASDDDDGVNKYTLNYRLAYELTGKNKAYIEHEYKHDQFGTYRHVFAVTLGLQRSLIASKKRELTIGAGPGYRYEKRQSNDDDYPNQETNDFILSAFINGSTDISSSLSVGGEADVDYGDSNTTYTLGGNLTNKLMGDVALVLDSQYLYNTQVAAGKSHDEIYSSVSLSYAF